MFLQTASIINAESTSAPRSTFEYDTCFKTAMPSIDNDNDNNNNINHVNSADPDYSLRYAVQEINVNI
jgi:hypothetical protein